ncbi:flagellar M-ring protein FliF [Granulicella rosea]|uniref:Flagellar M-ring protein FliF n=1 Tax=Granulicella rosea TaxID=474952 RepID=A0A239EKD5_9BACT|nr:flagellar basal-body MS-ring/collar protein FliF [Granulicella rosea]SNS44861.1 flagellar M-ring protein FliF [Granulicella rosea]
MAESGRTVVLNGGLAQKVTAGAAKLQSRWVETPAPRRNMWVVAAAMVAAVIAAMVWYAGRPDWRVLFSGLESKDVQVVSQELAAAGIPFELTPDGGGVQVPADSLEKARMEVAAKGMPQTGRLGFELFDKPNWVGSEFDERVNYQRALEGELEHTIESLDVVRSARVHLVVPQATLYSAQEKQAKASVVLKLKRASLPQEQADSIRSLVAGAVENLSMDQVTLVDANGRLNLQPHNSAVSAAAAEEALESKLVAMLEPLAGAGNVRATVSVAYEPGTEERTDEVYDPNNSVALTVRKSEHTSNGGSHAAASGVPGTASNAPAAAPAGAVQGSATAAAPGVPPLLAKAPLPVYPQAGGATQNVKEENGTYAVSRHVIHTEAGAGRVRRLTAAVVVNDRQVMEMVGKVQKTTWKPRSPEEMRRLEDLAQAAVGYDLKRGDQVVMQNVSFDSNTPEPKAAAMTRVLEGAKGFVQPSLLHTAMIGALGLLLVMVVLKPVAGQMVATLKETPSLGSGSSLSAGMEQTEMSVEMGGVKLAGSHTAGSLEASSGSADGGEAWGNSVGQGAGNMAIEHREEPVRLRPKSRDAIFDHVSQHIRQEPEASTRLLQSWIGSSDSAPAREV